MFIGEVIETICSYMALKYFKYFEWLIYWLNTWFFYQLCTVDQVKTPTQEGLKGINKGKIQH